MICVSTQQPFPGEIKVGFFRLAIADLKRYLVKSGRGEDMMIQLDKIKFLDDYFFMFLLKSRLLKG